MLFHPDSKTSHFAAELGKALEEAGGAPLGWGEWSRINHFLRAQGENAEQARVSAASAMASRQTTIVFEIEPRLPRKRAVELKPITR